jgi:hypothetical protein
MRCLSKDISSYGWQMLAMTSFSTGALWAIFLPFCRQHVIKFLIWPSLGVALTLVSATNLARKSSRKRVVILVGLSLTSGAMFGVFSVHWLIWIFAGFPAPVGAIGVAVIALASIVGAGLLLPFLSEVIIRETRG